MAKCIVYISLGSKLIFLRGVDFNNKKITINKEDEDFVIDNNQVITTHYHFPVEYLFKLCMDNNCIVDKGNLTNVEL